MAMQAAAAVDVEMAQANFEFENDVEVVQSADEIYRYDAEMAARIDDEAPWKADPKHFKKAHISALALLKMVMHARSGKSLEVMGLLQGKVVGDRMIVMDAFALPVEGTETRVNAGQAEYGYMCEYTEMVKQTGRLENVLGWYHSHPGYGCWLSGIDVSTQRMNQQYQDPWLAIVVDPVRTSSAGKVELGAFRCYPQGHIPADAAPSEYQTVPPDKIEDFGVHANEYYSLDVSYFKSSLDAHLLRLLWNKYWVNTLSSSPLVANAAFAAKQVADVASKVQKCQGDLAASSRYNVGISKGKKESEVQGAAHDAAVVSYSVMHGLMTQLIKHKVFNGEGARS